MNKELINKSKQEYGYNPLKKVFVPNMDELYKMQDMGANIYKYLVVKAAEVIIAEGVNYPKKGMLKDIYNTLKENSDLVRAICFLYPEEAFYSEIAKYDTELCKELIEKFPTQDSRIRNLDNLSYFEDNMGSNYNIMKSVISILDSELSKDPKYRFEFRSSKLLEEIFSRKFDLASYFYTSEQVDIANKLMRIEPAYAVFDDYFQCLGDRNMIYIPGKQEEFGKYVDNYARRYFISQFAGSEYKGKDILTNPDSEVKRLIKCINDRKDVVYNKTIIRK